MRALDDGVGRASPRARRAYCSSVPAIRADGRDERQPSTIAVTITISTAVALTQPTT